MVSIFNVKFAVNVVINQAGPAESADDDANTIFFVGPTGSGKSNLINALCMSEMVTSRSSIVSQTQGISVVQVTMSMPDRNVHNRRFNFIDFQGLCDTSLSNKEVLEVLKNATHRNVKRINRIVIVMRHGRLEPSTREAITDIANAFDLWREKTSVFMCVTHCEGFNRDSLNRIISEYHSDDMFRRLITEYESRDVQTGKMIQRTNIGFMGFPNMKELDEDFVVLHQARIAKMISFMWGVYCEISNANVLKVSKRSKMWMALESLFRGDVSSAYKVGASHDCVTQ